MHKPIIAANWKMNVTKKSAEDLIVKLNDSIYEDAEVIIMPPFTLLDMAASIMDSRIKLGAQNCYYKKSGAFTGEISPDMLVDIGCKYVIVGHSERRHIFGETNDILRKKLAASKQAGLIPIYCIGETLDEKREGKKKSVLSEQLSIIDNLSAPLIVAYEPVWAIGTGVAAEIVTIRETIKLIRRKLREKGVKASVLYGGSVKPDNAKEIASETLIDGALVGGSSLNASSFLQIIDIFKEVQKC